MKSQWKSYEELRELQNKKLRAILNHAYKNIPFYHDKFKKFKIHPSDIKTIDDLPKLPITTKQEIRNNFPDNIVQKGTNLSKCWIPHTSGSMGIPLNVVYDESAKSFSAALVIRPNISCGQKSYDKHVVLGTPHDFADQTKGIIKDLLPFRTIDISVFLDLDKQISLIRNIKPKVLDGYPSALYILAKELRRRGIDDINPELVFCTGEILTKEMRQFINSTFQVEMFDQFGCVELSRTAWECPEHAGYHINMESVVIELFRDGAIVSSGERGEILYTNLYNYTMPFIRYAIGDIGILSDTKCPCGRGLSLMETVEGRSNSLIKTPSGRVFPEMTFWSIMGTFSERDKIAQFRVIGKKIDRIKLQIVPTRGFNDKTAKNVVDDIKKVLGDEVHIEVELVNEIPIDKSGKRRSVVSNVEIDLNKI